MSQNKTVIQGLNSGKGAPEQPQAGPNFYQRTSAPSKGTVVPGMMENNNQPYQPNQGYQNPYQQPPQYQQPAGTPGGLNAIAGLPQQKIIPGKPVVGFLYSVSRTPAGEYWPLHIGRNTIGQTPDNDIVLAEGTVSSNHAVIVTRQLKSGVIAAITDAQSTNGTMINGEAIGFSAEECKNGDVITFGNNYQLVLMLVDTVKLNLKPVPTFIALEEESANDDPYYAPDFPSFDGGTKPMGGGGFDPSGWNPSNGGGAAGGTVGLNGMPGAQAGGTVPL